MYRFASICVVFGTFVCVASPASAQSGASIVGVVRDTSGAVLPGVTVEAASPALIEKVRTAVSDAAGQYRVEQLRPGTYSVTYTLPGFNTVQREGIELTGAFASTINVELKVGSVEETITVTGEAAVVDVRSATQQRVMNSEVLAAIPTARSMTTVGVLLPGINVADGADMGGTNLLSMSGGQLSIHGSQPQDQRQMIDGLSAASAYGSGAYSAFVPNMAMAQEVTIDYSSGTAEQSVGGIVTNMIPREGGNSFKSTIFATGVNGWFQESNYTQALKDRRLGTPTSIKQLYDVNPGIGGPLLHDKLWFFASARWARAANYTGGPVFANKNAGNPNSWTYDPDTTRPAFIDGTSQSINLRLTWQVTPRNKVSLFHDTQERCGCPTTGGIDSPESQGTLNYPINDMSSLSWTSPISSRLLFDARVAARRDRYYYGEGALRLTNIREQGGLIPGLNYRGGGLSAESQPFGTTFGANWNGGASLSFLTGGHRLKVGFSDIYYVYEEGRGDNDAHVTYRFLNGVPNQLTQRATPYTRSSRLPADLGIYAQDQWTVSRLTVNLGARFEYFRSYFRAQSLGPGLLVPTRNLSWPKTPIANWRDIVPRTAAKYDLFGNGKTALRVSANKYINPMGVQIGFTNGGLDPIAGLALTVTRSWTDTNGNFLPDCDLTNVFAQDRRESGGDFCGTVSDTNFGKPTVSTKSDPETLNGWGNRPYQWEFSTGVEHELFPRMSVNIGYFRRWFGNFIATDDLNLSASDFSTFSVTVPTDSRLPDGGGHVVSGYYDRNPDTLTRPQNGYVTFASSYGKQTRHWNGMDATVNIRMPNSVLLQGGVSTGRTTTDNCEIVAKLPEVSPLGAPFCHLEEAFRTQVKLLGSYQIPRANIQLSGTFQSIPGPLLAANQVIPNAVVRTSLGRDLAGGATVTSVGLFAPGTQLGDRLNQLDLRFSKLLRFGASRTSLNLDVYNALNVNTVLTENSTYVNATATGWRLPQSILQARFYKLSVQFDF